MKQHTDLLLALGVVALLAVFFVLGMAGIITR